MDIEKLIKADKDRYFIVGDKMKDIALKLNEIIDVLNSLTDKE